MKESRTVETRVAISGRRFVARGEVLLSDRQSMSGSARVYLIRRDEAIEIFNADDAAELGEIVERVRELLKENEDTVALKDASRVVLANASEHKAPGTPKA